MKKGFTLIELLVTIMIIGILVGIVTFGLRQVQGSSRDGRRKADLEVISIGLELYRADCNRYPAGLSFGGSLDGDGTGACTGAYIATVPVDPVPSVRSYSYATNPQGTLFYLCANLEQDPNPAVSTSGCASCNGPGGCDWRVARP
jgi:general secretion pathway protein G